MHKQHNSNNLLHKHDNTILAIKNLSVVFKKKRLFAKTQSTYAVNDVSFEVCQGEVLGIVGESGCGKSTLARTIIGLCAATHGSILLQNNKNNTDDNRNEINLCKLSSKTWRIARKEIQFIFQDPVASLDPNLCIKSIIAEPLYALYPNMSKKDVHTKVVDMMKLVGLGEQFLAVYPSQLSGGQCQRVGIARALILNPKIIICDEAVSALDVSIKAQIINLLKDLKVKLGLTIIFISHDLSIMRYICDRIMVMYLGRVMEIANTDVLYQQPLHPYTVGLLSAIPRPQAVLAKAESNQNASLNNSNSAIKDDIITKTDNANNENDNKNIDSSDSNIRDLKDKTQTQPSINHLQLFGKQALERLTSSDLPSPIEMPVGCVFKSRCYLSDDECSVRSQCLTCKNNGSYVACHKIV